MLLQTIWLCNHTSHTEVYFNEFVANTFRDNIGIVNFDLRGYRGSVIEQKTNLRAHHGTLTQHSTHPEVPVC